MATLNQSLKKLVYKITGKVPESNTENGILTEFSDTYTAPDMSDYATKHDLDEASLIFLVNLTVNSNVEYYYLADKTIDEIKQAVIDGKTVIFRAANPIYSPGSQYITHYKYTYYTLSMITIPTADSGGIGFDYRTMRAYSIEFTEKVPYKYTIKMLLYTGDEWSSGAVVPPEQTTS